MRASIGFRALAALLGLSSLALVAGPATAQQWPPNRQVTIVVPFPAGGTSDVIGRILAQKLGEMWGQTVVVENKPGAAGNIGAAYVATAPPDGTTLLIGAAAISTAQALYKDPGFKLFETLTPVTVIGTVPFMLVVHPSVPVKTVAEFVDYAKKNPDKLALGSGGNGTIPHLGGELFKIRSGITFTHVPYKGGQLAMNDLVAGQVQFTIDGGAHVVAQIDGGRIRLIATTGRERSPQYPNVPTIAESGYPGYEAGAWQLLLVPGGTPAAIVEKLQQDMVKVLQSPDVNARLQKLGIIPSGSTPAETDAFLRGEMKKWGEVIRVTGAKVE